MPWEARVLFTSYFKREESGRYWRAQLRAAIWTIVLGAFTWASVSFIALDGLPGLAVKGAVAFVVASSLTGIYFRQELVAFVNRIRNRVVH